MRKNIIFMHQKLNAKYKCHIKLTNYNWHEINKKKFGVSIKRAICKSCALMQPSKDERANSAMQQKCENSFCSLKLLKLVIIAVGWRVSIETDKSKVINAFFLLNKKFTVVFNLHVYFTCELTFFTTLSTQTAFRFQ